MDETLLLRVHFHFQAPAVPQHGNPVRMCGADPGATPASAGRAVVVELKCAHLSVEVEKEVVIFYKKQEVGRHRLDLVVENQIIVELKTVEDLSRAHYARVRSYLKAARLLRTLLVNFSNDKADFRRIEAVGKSTSPLSPSSP